MTPVSTAPFLPGLSVHGLHFTVYAPSINHCAVVHLLGGHFGPEKKYLAQPPPRLADIPVAPGHHPPPRPQIPPLPLLKTRPCHLSEQLPCRSAEVKFFSVFLCQRCREIWREILVKFSVLRFPGFGCAAENFTNISRQKTAWKTENFTQISLCRGAALHTLLGRFLPFPRPRTEKNKKYPKRPPSLLRIISLGAPQMWVWPQLLFGGSPPIPIAIGGPFPQAKALPSPPSPSLFPPTPLGSFCNAPGVRDGAAQSGVGGGGPRGGWRGRALQRYLGPDPPKGPPPY